MKSLFHFFVFSLTLICSVNLSAQSLTCRLPYIDGALDLKQRGTVILTKKVTTDVSELKVYITSKRIKGETRIYFQSNYVTPPHQYPTKILLSSESADTDLYSVIGHLIYQNPSLVDLSDLQRIVDNATIYLDYRVLENSTFFKLDLLSTPNINLCKAHLVRETPAYGQLLKIQERLKVKVSKESITSLQGEFDKTWREIKLENVDRIKALNKFPESIDVHTKVNDNYSDIISGFQMENGLELTGKFNYETESLISGLEDEILSMYRLLGENSSYSSTVSDVIRLYQSKYKLPSTGVFDLKTSSALNDQILQLRTKLNSRIHQSETLELTDMIYEYKEIVGLKGWEIIADQKFMQTLEADLNYYVKLNDQYVPFSKSNVSILNTSGEQLRQLKTIRYTDASNIHVEITDDLSSNIRLIEERLNWNYDLQEISVLPLTRNKDTRNLLKEKFDKNWIKTNLKSEKEISKRIAKNKGKTILAVGHIENGFFVDGKFRISLKKLNALAKENNVNIFHLGCSSAENLNVGTTASLNTYKTVDAIITSVKSNKNFKDFLIDFGKKGIGPDEVPIDLIIDSETFMDNGFASIKLYKNLAIGGATIGGAFIVYYLLSEEE